MQENLLQLSRFPSRMDLCRCMVRQIHSDYTMPKMLVNFFLVNCLSLWDQDIFKCLSLFIRFVLIWNWFVIDFIFWPQLNLDQTHHNAFEILSNLNSIFLKSSQSFDLFKTVRVAPLNKVIIMLQFLFQSSQFHAHVKPSNCRSRRCIKLILHGFCSKKRQVIGTYCLLNAAKKSTQLPITFEVKEKN